MNSRLRLLVVVSVVGVVLALGASAPPAEAQDDWWNNDWGYRAPIDITGFHQDDDVLRFTLDDADNLGGHIGYENFQDLRFFDENDTTPLDYWIEGYVPGDNVVILLKRPEADVDNVIVCYYGNGSCGPSENGDAVFILFDNFDGTTIDAAKWTEDDHANNYITQNDYLDISGGPASYDYAIYSAGDINRMFTLEYDTWAVTGNYAQYGIKDPSAGTALADWPYCMQANPPALDHDYYRDGVHIEVVSVYVLATEYTWRWDVYGTGVKIYRGSAGVDPTLQKDDSSAGIETPVRVGFGLYAQEFGVDNVRVRSIADNEVTMKIGTQEASPLRQFEISAPTVDNALIDRDSDFVGSTPILATQIKVQVISVGDENADSLTDNVNLFVKDAIGNVVVDNWHPIENSIVAENIVEYTFAAYNPLDAMTDASLGSFTAYVEATDNAGNFDNDGYTTLFTVSDLTDNAPTQENLVGHRHRIYGDAGRPDHGAVVLTAAWIVDNENGTIICAISGNDYENTYYPADNGEVYANFETTELDGTNDNDILTYNYPNFIAGIVSITADNTLIDNHRSDNAITATLITAIWEDNDGYNDFIEDRFWIVIRDNATAIVDNISPTSVTYENENRAILTYTYDAEDNTTLTDASMGVWEVGSGYSDNWEAGDSGWVYSVFTVDEVSIPIVVAADNALLLFAYNFNVLVSGTMVRESGAAITVDDSELEDEFSGTIVMGAAAAYSENYTITAPSGTDNVFIRVYSHAGGGMLDGENFAYYDVNDNRVFEIEVRFEENFGLWPDGDGGENSVDNRNYHLTFYFDNQRREFDMTTNPENFIVFDAPYKIRLDFEDNNFWRTRVIVTPGTITFVMPESLDNLTYYTFTLTDMTGVFGKDENGQLWLSRYYENDFMPIHEDYWSAANEVIAWLIYGEQYDVKLVTPETERATAPATMGDTNPVEVTIGQFRIPEPLEIWDFVYYAAWWNADNNIRVSYRDNQENTTSSIVRIYDENNDLVYSVTFLTDNWSVNWTSADPDTGYTVKIEIEQENYNATFAGSNLFVSTVLTAVWNAPLPSVVIPGTSQLGDLPFAYGSAIGMFFVIVVGLTYGKRHSGMAILSIAMFLAVLGPIMGAFTVPEIVIPMIATIGILVMLIPKR